MVESHESRETSLLFERQKVDPPGGRGHLAHGVPAVGTSTGQARFEPRRGDVGQRFDLTSPLRGWKCVSRSALTHGWLAVGHTMSPLRGFGAGLRPLGL